MTRRAEVIGSELIRRHAAIGSPALVADRIEEQRKAGADTIYFHIYDIDDLDHIALLGARAARSEGSPVSQQATEKSAPPRAPSPPAPRSRAHHLGGRSPSCASTHRATTRSGSSSTRRVVPLRPPHHRGRRVGAPTGGRRARGRRRGGVGRPARPPGQARRPGGLLLHPGLRQVPVLLDRAPEHVRRGQERRDRHVPRRYVPLPPRRRGPRRLLHAGTFSQYAVVLEWACIKLPDDIPFEIGSLVGCGVPRAGVRRCTRPACGPGTPWIYGAGGWAATRCRARGTPGRRTSWWSTRWSSSGKGEGLRGDAHVRRCEGRRTTSLSTTTHGQLADHAICTPGVLTEEIVIAAAQVTGKGGKVTITAVGHGEGGPRARRLPDRLPASAAGALFGDCNRSTTCCSGCTAPATSSWTS